MQIAINGRTLADCHHAGFIGLVRLLQEKGIKILLSHSLSGDFSDIQAERFTTLPKNTDFLISLGGDGTFLESVLLVTDMEVPVIGINTGRLGFLASNTLSESEKIVKALLTKNYHLEERTLLQVSGNFFPKGDTPYALNEIGIQKQNPTMISVKVNVNGEQLPDYWADGVLLSTPTGSTAYAMSVGGPLVMPGTPCFLLSPIASHNLSIRPLVMNDTSRITMQVSTRSGPAILSLDNRTYEIASGSTFSIEKAPFSVKIVRLPGNSFFSALNEKLLWGSDKRNSLY